MMSDEAKSYEAERERLDKILFEAAKALGEHFDSVRIVATALNIYPSCTSLLSCGSGNYYAQKASVEEWMNDQNEGASTVYREDIEGDDDDDDPPTIPEEA